MRRFAKPVYGVNLYRGFESRPLRSKRPRILGFFRGFADCFVGGPSAFRALLRCIVAYRIALRLKTPHNTPRDSKLNLRFGTLTCSCSRPQGHVAVQELIAHSSPSPAAAELGRWAFPYDAVGALLLDYQAARPWQSPAGAARGRRCEPANRWAFIGKKIDSRRRHG